MSKKVHDIRKVYLEATMCVLECFVEFYVFFCMKCMLEVLNSHAKIFGLDMSEKPSPKTIQGPLMKDPCWWTKMPKAVPPTEGNQGLVAWSTPRGWTASWIT